MKAQAKWFALGAFVLVLIAVGIIINNNLGNTPLSADDLSIYNGDINTNWDVLDQIDVTLSETYTITKSGVYTFTGTLRGGSIIINAGKNSSVRIILKNVSITNYTGPAIMCHEADNLLIEFEGDNYLADGGSYDSSLDQDVEGVIYSKADLALGGSGTLNLTSNYKDAIVAKDDLTIRGGTYNIKAADDAIRGKDSVYIGAGTLNIEAKEDGIKSTNNTEVGKGFVYVASGDLNLSVGDDGIHAENYLLIDDANIDITKSYEGLEGVKITINDGDIKIKSTDDGINAGGGTSESNTPRPGGMMDADEDCVLTINGGNVYIDAYGDGIDSNGYVYINGGNVVVDGPTNNGNGALDAGIGLFVNGGEVIAIGSSGMAEGFSEKSNINSVSIYLNSTEAAKSAIIVRDKDNNIILSHTAKKSFSSIVVASPKFVLGNTYTVLVDDVSYPFTIENTTTIVCNSMNMGHGGAPSRPDRF